MVNAEYPDLPFVPPAAFGKGRPAPPRVIVIHYTAGSERSTSAEDGAAYDQRRGDGTSTHYFVDSDSVVQCVYTWDRANAALFNGNRIGIQYELCGTVQTRAQWLDQPSSATLINAARQIVRDCAKYGIPPRRLTPAQVAAGEKGICGHVDITKAFPADGGDHTDPGPDFPWDVLIQRIVQVGSAEGDDMSQRASQLIEGLDGGFEKLPDGTPNELVRRRIRDEKWMAEVSRQLATLAPASGVDPVALARELAANEAFVRNLAAAMVAQLPAEVGRRLING